MEREPQEKETERGNEYRGTQTDVANNVSNMVMIRIHQSSFISFIGGEIATRSQNTDFIYLFIYFHCHSKYCAHSAISALGLNYSTTLELHASSSFFAPTRAQRIMSKFHDLLTSHLFCSHSLLDICVGDYIDFCSIMRYCED